MEERIYTVIAKVLDGEATQAEQQELQQWLAADAGNVVTYEGIKSMWLEADSLLAAPSFNTEAAWQKVAAATNIQPAKKRSVSFFPAWAKVSFAAAALLVVAFFVYKGSDDKLLQVTATAQNTEVILSDDTHVLLRKGASLSYPAHFAANERHVSLKGEAFFDVVHNEKQPFTIDAQAATIKVLGTSFDVCCDKEAAKVTVKTGKVQMRSNIDNDKAVVLTRGEQGKMKKGILSKENVSSDSYLYWKTGTFNFQDQSFSNIVKDLSSLGNTVIRFDASVKPEIQQSLVPEFSIEKDQTLDKMLEGLCLLNGCTVSKENGEYVLRAK